nr:MAG TPA: hypothetical protein [Caudoviricetes sp.]DAW50235.1 MAG TPA: hypothetical protein [Caudoviricetes sp.]
MKRHCLVTNGLTKIVRTIISTTITFRHLRFNNDKSRR